MNPISRAFLLIRQFTVNSLLENQGILLDIGGGVYPINHFALTLDYNEKKNPDICASVLNMNMIKNESIDEVSFCEVIEHISYSNQKIALKEIYRILKKGGKMVITTPNRTKWTKFIWDKIVWKIWSSTIQREYHNDHIGHLEKEELIRLLKESGFLVLIERRVMLFDIIVLAVKI